MKKQLFVSLLLLPGLLPVLGLFPILGLLLVLGLLLRALGRLGLDADALDGAVLLGRGKGRYANR